MTERAFEKAHGGEHTFELMRKASFSRLAHGGKTLPRAVGGMYDQSADSSLKMDSGKERLWRLMDKYLPSDPLTIQRGIVNHIEYTLAKNRFNFDEESCYRAAAYSVRDRLIESFNDTNQFFYAKDPKRCYYLSLEFLVGRAMQNALLNMDLQKPYKDALGELGYQLESLYDFEHDAALGNGGLGRLAACFLDSMACLNYPCWGFGIRYNYGIFEQKIVDGWQLEYPDYWLVQDNPWEICRNDCTYAVRFNGEVKSYRHPETGQDVRRWVGGDIIQAVAYDNPVPGYDTYNCLNLRLWRAAPHREFDFQTFNAGQYIDAVAERQDAECISAVLYPSDATEKGKELRLKQQYFFVCATLQDVLRRFKKKPNRNWDMLPEKVTLQLNDTHPTIAVPELMRILLDIEGLGWEQAWNITKRVCNYTNHTVLPEALEMWSSGLLGRLLPRHLEIINEINHCFLVAVRKRWTGNPSAIMRMSIYEEGWEKRIRMANLAVIGCRRVNGVAAIHTELVKRDLFPDFKEWFSANGEGSKFVNITNGVTPRRWVLCCNPGLADLMTHWVGSNAWLKDMDMLQGLANHAKDETLIREWQAVKLRNKERLADWILRNTGIEVDPAMLFNVQVKRIHEYKRQLLFALWMIHRYLTIKKMTPAERKEKLVPRCSMVGGKAAPGYIVAKNIIKLINCISRMVNADEETNKYFKVVFLPNYNVSAAEIIIPATDLTEQISTAGTEASGTGNMKFVMNGGLIIGTMDGANVEIAEECGVDTMFVFGAREDEVAGIRERAKRGDYPVDNRLSAVYHVMRSGQLTNGDPRAQQAINELVERLCNNGNGHVGDFYLVAHDFPDYCRAQTEVDAMYGGESAKWTQLCIKATSNMAKFSSDRTIHEYARLIWDIEPAERPAPDPSMFKRINAQTAMTISSGDVPVSPARA